MAERSSLRNEHVELQQTAPITPESTIALRPIGTYDAGGEGRAEIAAYDPDSQRVFVTNSETRSVDILDISDPSTPVLSGTIEIADLDPPYNDGSPNSVAVSNGVVAVALENGDPQEPGFVAFFDTDGNPIAQVEVGTLPDMLTFTPDGMKVLVANEGEPNDDYTNDPEGSVSIIDISGGVETLSETHVTMVGFTHFNQGTPGYDSLLTEGDVRIFGPGASVAQDLEPEYIAVSDDGETAWVTLQENNALAIIDTTAPTVTEIVSFGFKDHRMDGNGIDASDEDGTINIQTWPVWGMYQPDAIASFTVGDDTYLVTANEGDARDYTYEVGEEEFTAYSEEVRIEDLVLDTGTFSEELQAEDMLGRLKVTTATLVLGPIWSHDPDGDDDTDTLYAYGARSFSIWNSDGVQVYDSGDEFEQITAAMYPGWFNGEVGEDFDSRSDDKGPEPEGVAIGQIEVEGEDRTFAFIGLERIGGIMVYDVTDPQNPAFVQYVNTREQGDIAPEGLAFISATDSPNGNPLLVVAYEDSGTTTIYDITDPDGATTLTLLHNNDGESSLTPFTYGVEPGGDDYPNTERVELHVGGVSAFKSLMDAQIAEARMDDHSVVSVYAGDAFLASPTTRCSDEENGSEPLFDAMAQKYMPYDAHILGNHEFDFEPDVLAEFIEAFAINGELQQPFLSANLDFSAEPSFADLTMDSADPLLDGLLFTPVTNGKVVGRSAIVVDKLTGQRFGIVGMTTPMLATISSPENVVVDQDIETIAQNEIDRLYDDYGVRKIIFVSHLQNVDNDRDLIEQLEKVDLAVAGGGDEMLISSSVPTTTQMLPGELAGVDGPYPIEVEDPDGRTVYIVTTAGNYKYLGRIDAEFDSDGEITSIVADMSYPRRVIPDSAENADAIDDLELTDAVAPDAMIESEVIEPLETCFASYPLVARTEVLLNVSHSGGAYGELEYGVRTAETNAGNLVADSYLEAYEAVAEDLGLPPYDETVVAVQNGGGMRQNVGDVLPVGGEVPGTISRLHTGGVLAFSNNVAVVPDVTPEEVKRIFERSVSSLPGAGGQFLQVAGLWVRYDLDGTAQKIAEDGTVTTPGSRVVSILLDDGTPIVQDGEVVEGAPDLTIVTNHYTAGGGDNYVWLKNHLDDQTILVDTEGMTLTYEQAWVNYLLTFPETDGPEGMLPTILDAPETYPAYQPGGEGRIRPYKPVGITPTVQFDREMYTVEEMTGTAMITVTLSVTPTAIVSVDYLTADDTAMAGSDYTTVSGTLTFAPGEMSQSFEVPILVNEEDDVREEMVLLMLENPVNAVPGPRSEAMLTIVDPTAPDVPRAGFSSDMFEVREEEGTAMITVTLNMTSTYPVSVDYTTSDGTAMAGSDYMTASGTLTFAPDETVQTFDIEILSDFGDEPEETVHLMLSNPVSATLGSSDRQATLTIIDATPPTTPTVQFSSSTFSAGEDAGTTTVMVELSHAYDQEVTVDYATSGDTATAGSDYEEASGTLTFAVGETSQTFDVTILTDDEAEADETVQLTLSDPSNADLGDQAVAVLTITDVPPVVPTVQFGQASFEVNESDGTATIAVTLDPAAEAEVTVEYATSDGTATAGSDYEDASGTLTFAVGETSQTFDVTILTDDEEETDETVQLTLSNPSTSAALGDQATATLTITEPEPQGGLEVYLPLIR